MISWIVFGLIVGIVACAIYPGEEGFGYIQKGILGVIGSFAGGTLWSILFSGVFVITAGSLFSSIIGAVLLLYLRQRFFLQNTPK